MSRLKISDSTLKKLFALSGNCCAFPNCTQKLIDDSGNLIAQICHIEAANVEGQRYNPNQNDEERRDFSNLVIMCPNHHKITDDVEKYSTPLLQKIKADHEAKFKNKNQQFELEKEALQKISEQVNNFNFENNSGQQNLNQGGTQIIQNGLTVTETRQIVSDQIYPVVEELKKNFIHLSKESKKTVDERIQSFLVDNFTPKFIELTSRVNNLEVRLKSPDVQYSFNQVLQAVGRRSSPSFNQSLANLMIARIESEDNSAEALIYNEAIAVFPKLTSTQLGILSLAFLTHSVESGEDVKSDEQIIELLESRFGWLENNNFGVQKMKEIDFSHLEYAGAANVSTQQYNFDSVVTNYKFFGEYLGEDFGFSSTLKIKTDVQQEIKSKIVAFYNLYSNNPISTVRLTSVGTVLAIHWLKIIANLDFETGLWLQI